MPGVGLQWVVWRLYAHEVASDGEKEAKRCGGCGPATEATSTTRGQAWPRLSTRTVPGRRPGVSGNDQGHQIPFRRCSRSCSCVTVRSGSSWGHAGTNTTNSWYLPNGPGGGTIECTTGLPLGLPVGFTRTTEHKCLCYRYLNTTAE